MSCYSTDPDCSCNSCNPSRKSSNPFPDMDDLQKKPEKAVSQFSEDELLRELNRRKDEKENKKKIADLRTKLSKSLKTTEQLRRELKNLGYYEGK